MLPIAIESKALVLTATLGVIALNAIGNVIVVDDTPAMLPRLPPWVQVGNDADPDECSGSFTENRQNWKRRHDAERRNFQQN